ncbi:MAG TPA: nucleotidyltransferase family protein [Bryobacteraceae bacterium]|nr:nucleotidyltransferase family protein [Bryobacteraceae bacterium]
MTLDELRRSKKDQILRIAAIYGASNVRVFGSLARGENSPSSDVDILVDLDPNRSLMDLGGLLMDLQEILPLPVDVATEDMLRPKVRARALLDAVPL